MNTPNKKTNSGSAVTILITTASIAATITGWAIFANKDGANDASLNTVVAAAPAATNSVFSTRGPLPTLVPLIGTTPQATNTVQTDQVQTKRAVPTAQMPTVQQPLRNVNQAPRPVVRSRSSR